MKKVFPLVLLISLLTVRVGAVNVTFRVDMSQQTVSPQGVHVAGSFNGWSTTATLMTHQGNNIYAVTLDLSSGTAYQYKFINGDTWAGEEIVPAACGVPNGFGGYNRQVTVGNTAMVLDAVCFSQCGPCQAPVQLTLQVDMSLQTVSPQGVHVAGSFNNWSTTATLMNPIGNGVYAVTISVNGGTAYQYKFINGDTWAGEEIVPAACGVPNGFGGYNREVNVGTTNTTVPVVCFSMCGPCSVPQVQLTLQVDMSQQAVSPNGVHVAGTFNNWSASATPMNPAGNGVYVATVSVDQNSSPQYVFINGNDWSGAETVPASCGVPNGLGGYNRQISVGTSNTTAPLVCFSACDPCPGMVNLTLQVDMGMQNVSPQGVHVAGSFNGWSTTATPMSLVSGTVYSVTIPVVENSIYEYVFINGDTWAGKENVPPACGVPNGTGGYNRQVQVAQTAVTQPLVCFGWCEACPPLIQVTFRVDMSLQTVAPEGVHIVGSFQGWDPTTSPMIQTANNVWERTFQLYQGESYQFKFINGNTWAGEETVPASCGVPNGSGGYNRQVIVGSTTMLLPAVCFSSCDPCPVPRNVTFRVDMSQQTVSPDGVHIAGSFQGWDPAATPMNELGNGIFQYTTQILPGEQVQYKFINGNTWAGAENVPEACGTPNGMGGFNRYFTMPAADTILGLVCFGECTPCQGSTFVDVVFYVDMSQQTVSPNGVHLAGSFQGWNPAGTPMTYFGGGIYKATVLLQENQYIEYKFINGNDWSGAEQVPEACGVPTGVGGFNRYLTVPAGGTSLPFVCFGSCNPCVVGLNEEPQPLSFEVYPNPSQGRLMIDVWLPQSEKLRIQLISMMGQLLKNLEVTPEEGMHNIEILVPEYQGMAFLRIIREDGSLFVRKILFVR